MSIESSMVSWLLSESSITDLIANRLQPKKMAQQLPVPGVNYSEMENKPVSGNLTGTTPSLYKVVYGFEIFSTLESDVLAIQQAFKNLIQNGIRTTVGDYSYTVVKWLNSHHRESQVFEGSDVYPYRKIVYLVLWYNE